MASLLLVFLVAGCGLGVGWSSYGPETGAATSGWSAYSPVQPFIEFASSPSAHTWSLTSFTETVDIGLANEPLVHRSAEALKDPKAWELDKRPYWRGGVGPFSALETLRSYSGELRVTKGLPEGCGANERLRVSKSLRRFERWSIRPADASSCTASFSVDLFLAGNGSDIRAVVLELYEP